MNLGKLDVCIRVADLDASRSFYEGLGFVRVEGTESEDWGVWAIGSARIGLFSPRYMAEDAFSLNFRDGDLTAILSRLDANGLRPIDPPISRDSAGSIRLRDPDGNLVFIDSANGVRNAGV